MAGDASAGISRTAKRPYWREADGQAMVDAWRRSGKRLSEFAREQGVQARRLRRWVARLEPAERHGEVSFHPVRLTDTSAVQAQRDDVLEVVLGDGRAVRVPYGFAPEHLRRVLHVLETEA
jgi:transposase-like protein